MSNSDTIAAIATGPGSGGIGVVRISGVGARQIGEDILGGLPQARMATHRTFKSAGGAAIDAGLAIFFEAPNSYTGEDVLELQGHGGPAVLRLLLRSCIDSGARLAEPGEFTQRAYLNDKLDLAQAESVADLIGASSAAAVLSAHRSLSGDFSNRTEAIKNELIEIRVFVEAAIDFSDEEIDFLEDHSVNDRIKEISKKLELLRGLASQGSLLREGVKVVLTGEPNVGKSTLMNLLSEEEVSIVTEHAGTTRDSIQRHVVIGGVPMLVIDTAGLRVSEDPVEAIGIARALTNAGDADVVLEMRAAGMKARSQTLSLDVDEAKKIIVVNKIDLLGESSRLGTKEGMPMVCLSAKTGDGLEMLKSALLEKAGVRRSDEAPFMARERHLNALERAAEHVSLALVNIAAIELCAEELRMAQNAVSEITGEFVADDLLGEIFSSFCVGK